MMQGFIGVCSDEVADTAISTPHGGTVGLLNAWSGEQKIKGKREKPIIHPVFAQIIPYISDPEWAKLMDEFSRGKLLYGFTFNGTILTYKRYKSISELQDIPQDPQRAAYVIIDFIRKTKAFTSQVDQLNQEISPVDAQVSYNSWSDIKKRKTKLVYLDMYIESVIRQFSLSRKAGDSLKTIIFSEEASGGINKDNVTMQGGYIVRIDGIAYNQMTDSFYSTLTHTIKKSSKSKKKQTTSLTIWSDVCRNLTLMHPQTTSTTDLSGQYLQGDVPSQYMYG